MKRESDEWNPAWEGRQPLLHPPLSEADKAALFAAYERITGRRVWDTMTGSLYAGARKHGPDSIPLLEALHAEHGVVNLLARWKAHPVRSPGEQVESSPSTALPSSKPLTAPPATPPSETRTTASIATEWTPEEIAEVDRELLGLAPEVIDAEPIPRSADDEESRQTTLVTAPSEPNAEIAWRVEAMRSQYPDHGAIPLLRARSDQLFAHDVCVSCGDPLSDVRPRCRPCVGAAKIVLGEHP